MKKIILPLAFLCILAASAFGQTQDTVSFRPSVTKKNLVGIVGYSDWFSDGVEPLEGTARIANRYYRNSFRVAVDILTIFAQMDGVLDDGRPRTRIDNELKWALASYYSPAIIDLRPPEADAILPKNNPKLSDQKLGAAVYQELQILRFLADTAAVNRHETVLKFITDRGNATRAEIEQFYRDNVRALIAAAVDEEFNKVSFSLYAHNAVLIRNPQNGQYTLSYGGVNTNNETRTVTANSLELLISEMQNGANRADFRTDDINTVRARAALIPAVALSDTALNEAKTILTNFYITPNATTYACVKEVDSVWSGVLLSTENIRYGEVYHAYERVLLVLNEGLGRKVRADVRVSSNISTLTREQQQRLVQLR